MGEREEKLRELAEALCDCDGRRLNGRARELANEIREALLAEPQPTNDANENLADYLLRTKVAQGQLAPELQSRSVQRRVASQKGEPVPTFEQAMPSLSALSEKDKRLAHKVTLWLLDVREGHYEPDEQTAMGIIQEVREVSVTGDIRVSK